MFLFFCRILMITTFFIGLGAITDTFLQIAKPTKETCKFNTEMNNIRQIKFIRFENIEGLPKTNLDKPLQEKKIVIFRQFYLIDFSFSAIFGIIVRGI